MIKRGFALNLSCFLGLILLGILGYLVNIPVANAATAYYVDAASGSNVTGNGSQASPWQSVSYALSQVIGPDVEIHVAPGVYDTALGESFPIVMEPSVKLIGSGSEDTILYGDGVSDIIYFPRTAFYTETTVISGFKITHGYIGVYLDGRTDAPSTPIIEHNWITANYKGIRNYAVNYQRVGGLVRNNRISYNVYHGIDLYAGSNGSRITSVFSDNEITHNGGDGIYCFATGAGNNSSEHSHCLITVDGNLIAYNSGSGHYCSTSYAGSCRATIRNNQFIANGGWGVGRKHQVTYLALNNPVFVNNVFIDNGSGGAQFVNNDQPSFINNTVAYNGPYGIRGTNVKVVNSIVWGHADDLNVDVMKVSYSNIGDGEYGGVNDNISDDPQFADPAQYDLHLLGSSTLIDGGNSVATNVPTTDIDGDPRILGSAVDIGADETTSNYQIAIQKSAFPASTVIINELITYTLTLINNGPASAAGVHVTDTLPVETTWDGFVTAPNGYITVTNGVLSWTGSVAAGITETIDYAVRVNPMTPLNSQIINTASVQATNGTITVSQPVTVTVGPTVYWGLSSQKVNHDNALSGQLLTYTLSIVNGGNINATGVVVTDTIDNKAGFISADNGGVFSNGRVLWSALSIDAGDTVTLTAVISSANPITTGYNIVNQVAISGGGHTYDIPDVATVLYNHVQAVFDADPRIGPAPLNVTFFNQSQNVVTSTWAYGDGITNTVSNPAHMYLYQNSGVYSVTLTALNPVDGQVITYTHFITAYDAPKADFVGVPVAGNTPLLVEFTNTSLFADEFVWDYGNGITSTVTTVTHTHLYTTPGSYDVSLTASNEFTSHTKVRNNYIGVYDSPVAAFTGAPTEGVAPLVVNFTNNSTNASTYLWDFGDGQTSGGENPIKTYWASGIYTVTLTAFNNGGSSTVTKTAYITVYQPPTASFSGAPLAGFAPLTVTLTNSSDMATSFMWHYGDGAVGTTAAHIHQHIYEDAGLYTVVLTAFNPYGSDAMTRNNYIAVYDAPLPDYSAVPVSGIEPLVVQFNNLTQNADSYLWTFGDGAVSTAASPSHTYTDGGTYTVTLRASNPGGSVYLTRTNYITVHEAPEAGFVASPHSGLLTLTVTFTNTSLFADSYLWDYGDGTTGTTTAPVHTHTYAAPEVYDVSLTAVNAYSSSVYTEPDYITVYGLPQAAFTGQNTYGPVPLTVDFENQSQNAISFTWQFGDGSGSTAVTPTHLFTTPGYYTVTLIASNPYLSHTVTRTGYITAYNAPVAHFSAAPRIGEAPLTVTFTNESLNSDTFIWDYGNGQSQAVGEIEHTYTYTMPGVYTVTLTAANAFDTGTTTRTSYIAVIPVPTQPAYFVDALNGSNMTGDGSQAAPWQTISHALAQVNGPNKEIHVAPGVYDTNLGESFPIVMEPGISLIGSGSKNTILYGAGTAHVVQFPGTAYYDETTILRGFKITNGDDGVRIDGRTSVGSSPVIEENWITDNFNGVSNFAVTRQLVAAVIRNNQIDYNASSGIELYGGDQGSKITSLITNNEITYNGLEGVYCYASGASSFPDPDNSHCNVTISNNLIAYNAANGFRCRTFYAGECKATLINNYIIGNSAWGVGRNHSGTYIMTNVTTLINNIIAGNGSGGALFRTGDKPLFVNNTVAYNGQYGIRDGTPTIVNSIIWGNVDNLNIEAQYVSYSNVGDGEYGGTNNNISVDPQFMDPDQFNLHILDTSPMIDAGNNAVANLPASDIDGEDRILNEIVDIGADEFSPIFILNARQTADPNPAIAGEPLTFTIVLTNMGNISLDLVVTDTLSAQVTPTGTIVWNPSISPGTAWQQQLVVTVQEGYSGSVWNSVSFYGPGGLRATDLMTTTIVEQPVGLNVVSSSPTMIDTSTHFTATVTAGTDVTYTWDFGDSSIGSGPMPEHTYLATGTYDIIVTAANMVGSISTTTTVEVFAPVSAGFEASPTNGVAPVDINFHNLSTGSFDTCLWNFGDGATSSACENPIHQYTVPGVYDVTLTASGLGGTDTYTETAYITVFETVTAGFTIMPSEGPMPLPVQFTNLSSGSFDTCLWDFGDGNSSTDCIDPIHSYTITGTFTVSLSVSGPGGSDMMIQPTVVTVYQPGSANFSADVTSGPEPLVVTFDNLSTGDFTSCEWTFGDGGSSSICANPVYTYTVPGTYSVTLTINGPGGTDFLVRENFITVHESAETYSIFLPIVRSAPPGNASTATTGKQLVYDAYSYWPHKDNSAFDRVFHQLAAILPFAFGFGWFKFNGDFQGYPYPNTLSEIV